MRTRVLAIRLLLSALPVLAINGTIIDRTAITVANKVITDSEITRRIRLAAFQNGLPPDFGLAARREAGQRLIDLRLVEREMDIGHYTRTSPDEVKALMDKFTEERYGSSNEALQRGLAATELTISDLEAEFAEQTDLLTFTNLRFKPAVDVSDQEVEEYFKNHIQANQTPDAAGVPVTLADMRTKIEQILVNERADLDLDAWLRDQRVRTKITYLEKDLE